MTRPYGDTDTNNVTTPFGGSFSTECWIKHNLTGFQRAFGGAPNSLAVFPSCLFLNYDAGANAVHNGFVAFYDDVSGADADALTCSGSILVNDNKWHHIVLVRDTSLTKLFIYIDGTQDASRTEINAANTDSGAFSVGTDRWPGASSGNYSGYIDEIALYNTALSAARIKAHYNEGALRGGVILG